MSSPLGIFIIGEVVVLFFGLLLAVGMKQYFMFQKIMFVVGIVGFALGVAVMLANSQATFISRFNQFMSGITAEPDAYHAIINTARQQGFTPGAPFSLLQTGKLMVWVFLGMGFVALSSSFAGEIKNVQRNQMLGMVGAALVAGFAFIIWTQAAEMTFGTDFIQSVGWLSTNAPGKSIFPTTPFTSLFAAILTNNMLLTAIIMLGFFSWSVLLPGVCFVYSSRAILAWSLDRLAPNILGEVSEKYHTPINTIVLIVVLGTVFNALYASPGSLGGMLTISLWGTLGLALTFFATCVAGTVFPYVRKEFYKGSAAEMDVGGIPVMTIAGIIASVYVGGVIYFFLTESAYGVNTPIALGGLAAVFIVGAILYEALKWHRRRQGIDVELAYKEIPIE
jgi:amino acid transporter